MLGKRKEKNSQREILFSKWLKNFDSRQPFLNLGT